MKTERYLLALAACGLVGWSSTVWAQEGPRAPKKPPAKTAPAKTAPAAKAAPAKAATAKAAPAKTAEANPSLPRVSIEPVLPPALLPPTLPVPAAPAAAPVPFEGLLGVMVGMMTPASRAKAGAPPTAGLVVNKVIPGSVASVAGVEKDDVVIDVGGASTRSVDDVRRALGQMNVGDLLTVQVIRDQKPKTLFATLMPKVPSDASASKSVAGATAVPAKATLDGNLHFVGEAAESIVPERVHERMKRIKRRVRLLQERRLRLLQQRRQRRLRAR